jgi:hypothetical protein
MKHAKQVTLVLLCLGLSLAGLYASPSKNAYIGFGKGDARIDTEKAPFLELVVGTKLSNRTAVEGFVITQAVSDFPGTSFDLSITETDGVFAVMTGMNASLRLFSEAAFNPMIQAGIGNMVIVNMEDEDKDPILHSYFYSSLATGIELQIFKSVDIAILSGYRFAPHQAVAGMDQYALSSRFSSITFKAQLK